MKTLHGLVALCALACASARGDSPKEAIIENFRLTDHRGSSHELHYYSYQKALVLMTQQNDCAYADRAMENLERLQERFKDSGVQVFMLNGSMKDTRQSVAANLQRLGVEIPVLDDELQLVSESIAVKNAGEFFVIDPNSWRVIYRGPYGEEKGTSGPSAAAAVESLVSGAPAPSKRTSDVPGCRIDLPESKRRSAHARISYARTIAPVLKDKCVACHRAGGIGPWQMTSYEVVKGFAPMIRETIRTQRMPPWHADAHYGAFKNNRALSPEQAKALVHWIEAGSPRGTGPDPLAVTQVDRSEWTLGTPDFVVETPAFTLPATGIVDYRNPVVKNPAGKDVWVRAIEFIPGERSAVHHILGYGTKQNVGQSNPRGIYTDVYLGGYSPGGGAVRFPDDTGVFLGKDVNLRFQIHFTTTGKPVTDVTRIGIYTWPAPPKYPLRSLVLFEPALKIPAHASAHKETAGRELDRDILIYSLTAHAHYRAVASNFVAYYPDGREEILVSIPKYDFNWQTVYDLAEPKLLPKGTRLVHTTIYDNSSHNRANPDPTVEVKWGEQTSQEMIYGNVRLRILDETVEKVGSAPPAPMR